MLLSCAVENFRSFLDEQELSLVANSRQSNLLSHLVEIPAHEQKVLPLAAIYGANGAGKSNFVRALRWMKAMVLRSTANEARVKGCQPFLFARPERATRVSLRFLRDGFVFDYAFSAFPARIDSEWLDVISPTGRELVLYERRTTPENASEIEYGDELGPLSQRLQAMRTLGPRSTELFLSRIIRDIPSEELPKQLVSAMAWFKALEIISADSNSTPLFDRLTQDIEYRSYVEGLLRRADTGVSQLAPRVVSHHIENLGALNRRRAEKKEPGARFIAGGLRLVKVSDELAEERSLRTLHTSGEGSDAELDFSEESDGTQRLAHLAAAAFAAGREPSVLVVDELDRSLHAVLVKTFVGEFLSRANGKRNQLIFTTHETHVLDQDLLRRDEVWFAQKSANGATELFSLDDFPVRNDLRLDRSYLSGRFGAVPPTFGPA